MQSGLSEYTFLFVRVPLNTRASHFLNTSYVPGCDLPQYCCIRLVILPYFFTAMEKAAHKDLLLDSERHIEYSLSLVPKFFKIHF